MELEEGLQRVQITISVLRTFKQLFHTYRQRVPEYYKRGQVIKQWDFPAALVFERSDHIMKRLLMIEVSEVTGHRCVFSTKSHHTITFHLFVSHI